MTDDCPDEINLTIKDFNKLIKRKDYKQKKWWAFDVDLLTHPDFFGLDGNDFKVFCWVISVANKFGNPEIRLHIKQASHILFVSPDDILKSLKKLEGKRWFMESRNESVTDTNGNVPKNRIDKIRIEESRIDINSSVMQKASPSKSDNIHTFSSKEEFIEMIGKKYMDLWIELYEKEYIDRQLIEMEIWLSANKRKNKKTHTGWVRFVSGWLKRNWDKYINGLPTNKKQFKGIQNILDEEKE